MTGEPIRLEAAKKQFEKFYTENMKGSVPVKKISVSLYGFDMGATLARKFLDNFLQELCQKNKEGIYQYKNVSVDIAFVGLLIAHAIRQPVVTTGWTIFLCGWVYRET